MFKLFFQGLLLPQICLLCDEKLEGPAALATHIFETHDLDFNKMMENLSDKKKRIPNLLKISNIKRSSSSGNYIPFTKDFGAQILSVIHSLSGNSQCD